MTPSPSTAPAAPGRLRQVWAMTRTEMLRIVRDRTALFFIIVLPVVIITIIGATIGASPRHAPVGVVDLDGSPASAQLRDALAGGDVLAIARYEDVTLLEADIRIQNLIGGVVIPRGYGDAVTRGDEATVAVYADQTQTATTTLLAVVNSVIDREGQVLAAAAFASRESGTPYAASRDAAIAQAARVQVIGVRTESVGRESLSSDNQYEYTAPSNLVLFVFITALTAGAAMVESRRLGVTRRVLAAPLSAGTIVLGMGCTRFLVALLQSALILGVGAVLFGVDWGNPVAGAALVLVFALLSTGAGLLIGTVARTPEQVQSIGIPVAIGMAMLGGCMWPLEVVSETLRTLGHVTPHAWAMDAWIAVIFEGESIAAIVPNLLVLSGFAVALLALASWRLRKTLT